MRAVSALIFFEIETLTLRLPKFVINYLGASTTSSFTWTSLNRSQF